MLFSFNKLLLNSCHLLRLWHRMWTDTGDSNPKSGMVELGDEALGRVRIWFNTCNGYDLPSYIRFPLDSSESKLGGFSLKFNECTSRTVLSILGGAVA